MSVPIATDPERRRSFEDLLAPRAPHDDLTFQELAERYNFQKTSDWIQLFVRLLIKECRRIGRPVRALDIGCGYGIGRSMELLEAAKAEIDELWGLEPDPAVKHDTVLFANFQNSTMEQATLPENYFDIAFSFMVMEHVADPVRYLNAVNRCLKPGGTHFFITVNGHHYFTRIALTMKRLKIDEIVLRILRGKHVDEYHYPVQYRCNKPRVIEALAARTGFEKPEFVFVEEDGPKPYMPGPLRPIWALLMWKRRVLRNPRSLLTLIVRMKKKA